MRINYIVILFFLLLSKTSIAQTTDPLTIMEEGNKMYEQGDYSHAIVLYSSLLEKGYQSEDLFFNLGNAYFKNQNHPLAILYYEKALKINPSSDDAQFNLAIANDRTIDKIEAVPELFLYRWWKAVYNLFSADTWARITLGLLFTALLGFGLFLLGKTVTARKSGFYLLVCSFTLAALSFFLANQQKAYLLSKEYAIIIKPTVNIISAPSDGSSQLFVLHEGTKVKIKDYSTDWLKITLPNGNEGWLKQSELELI